MPFTYSRFAYFDTNLLSYLVKAVGSWTSLRNFLFSNDLALAVSGIHLAELSNFQRNHKNLSELLLSVPSALIKTHDAIISEEVKAYPATRNEDLLYYPLQLALAEPNGDKEIERQLSSYNARSARTSLDYHAGLAAKRLQELKLNFSASKSGSYVTQQAALFSKEIVWQWLSQSYPAFTASTQKDELLSEKFQSIWLVAQMIFHRYYLGKREYARTSDFGDLHHCAFLSYCNLIVVERDMAAVLKRIQRNHPGIIKAEIHDIDFLYQNGWKQKSTQ